MRKQILSLLLLIFTVPAFGFAGIVTGKAEVDAKTKYVYRGIVKEDAFVLQPKASLSFLNFRAKLFNNVTLSPEGDNKNLDETHFTLRYDLKYMGFNLTPGVKYYHGWNDNSIDTTEVSLGVSYTLLGLVGIYSTHYIDVMEDFGKYYGNVGAAFQTDKILLGLGVEGYMDINWQKPDFNDDSEFIFPYSMNVGAAVKFKPIPVVYIKAHADMSILLTEEAREMNSNETNIFSLGVIAGLEF